MIHNQYPNARYMYGTTVKSVGAGCVVDTDGRVLRMIGNYPVKAGDVVYTDGEIMYGHVPIRQQAKLHVSEKGIPVYCWGDLDGYGAIMGYFELNGMYHSYAYRALNTPVPSQVLNDERQFFYDAVYHNTTGENGRYPVDIEVDADGAGYYAAVGKTSSADSVKAYHIVNAMYTKEGALVSGTVVLDDYLEIYHISKDAGVYSQTLIERIDLHDYLPSVDYLVEKFNEYQSADSAPTENPIRLDSLITQLVDFRFVDRDGNWEMVLAGFATGKLLVDHKTESQNWFSRPVSINYSSTMQEDKGALVGRLPIGSISEGLYLADVYEWKVTVKGSAEIEVSGGSTPDSKDMPTDVPYHLIYVMEKITSGEESEVVQKIVKRGTARYVPRGGRGAYRVDTQEITGGTGWTNFSGSYSYKELRFTSPYHTPGDYNVIGFQDPLDANGIAYSTDGSNNSNHANADLPPAEEIDAEPFEVNLGNGYTAMTDGMQILSITGNDGEVVIPTPLPQETLTYLVEPTVGHESYDVEPKIEYNSRTGQVRTNYAIRHYSDGHTEETKNDYSKPCFCDAERNFFYSFPHVCVGKLKKGWLIAILHEKLYKLLKGDGNNEQAGNGLVEEGYLSVNYRLNEARNVRGLK